MCLFRRSRVSVSAPGHCCRGSVLLLEGFYFRGNKKVMRFMKTNTQNNLWPSLTAHPWVYRSNPVKLEGKTVKSGHTRGLNGQTWSHPGGLTVNTGHPRGEM